MPPRTQAGASAATTGSGAKETSMAAYVIADIRVTDPVGYAFYRPLAAASSTGRRNINKRSRSSRPILPAE
jgi:hypothetical protein